MDTKKNWMKLRLERERQTDDLSDGTRTCVYLRKSYVYIYTADRLPVQNYCLYMPLLTLYTLQHAVLR
jgi:hypothetical protein